MRLPRIGAYIATNGVATYAPPTEVFSYSSRPCEGNAVKKAEKKGT